MTASVSNTAPRVHWHGSQTLPHSVFFGTETGQVFPHSSLMGMTGGHYCFSTNAVAAHYNEDFVF